MILNNVPFNADLSDILTELQTQVHKSGLPYLNALRDTPNNIMCSCPYHKDGTESNPSAGISKSTGIFHCFACGEVHTLPEVVSYCLGHQDDVLGSFGWNWLLKNFVSINVEERKDVVLDTSRTVRPYFSAIDTVSEDELDSYRFYHSYMYKRKLTDPIINYFDIGYDKARECITFPVRNIKGDTLFIARRSVLTKYFNYPAGVEKPLYGLYEYSKSMRNHDFDFDSSEIIVCESMLDALTCWVYGKYAVALNGLGNDLQFLQLQQLPCRKLILATDNDMAGMRARTRIRKNIKLKLITEYILPNGRKDINELSKDEFDNLIEEL